MSIKRSIYLQVTCSNMNNDTNEEEFWKWIDTLYEKHCSNNKEQEKLSPEREIEFWNWVDEFNNKHFLKE